MYYYKYTDHHAVDVLTDLRLKVTPPKEFNDPFEFLPHISATLNMGKAKKMLKEKATLKTIYGRWVVSDGFKGTFKDFKQLLDVRRDDYAKLMVDRFGENLGTYRERYQDSVSKDYGILCLSKTPTSLLMWSHYADSHKGVVIAIKADRPPFTKDLVIEVDYIDERVSFDPTWPKGSPDFQKYTNAIVRRKSSHWHYEEELRALFNLSRCTAVETKERRLYFFDIPKEAIAKVIFGMRCPPELRAKIKEVSKQKGLSIQFEEARHHPTKFALELHPA